MRLTTKGRYAVKAMLDIAIRAYEIDRWHGDAAQSRPKRAVSLADIAERQDISLTYLEQLFRKLRRADLVSSVRGPGGGYMLTRPGDAINVADIMAAVGEGIEVAQSSSRQPNKLAENLWADLTNQIHSFLSNITLADLIARHENQQLSEQLAEQQTQLFDFGLLHENAVNSDVPERPTSKRKNLIVVSSNS